MTEFKLKKIVGTSQGVQFSHLNCAAFDLQPGRYAIVPYTHTALDAAMEYMLHVNYTTNHVEFEVEDVLAQRLTDDNVSDDEDEIDDNDLIQYDEDKDHISILSYEKVREYNIEDEVSFIIVYFCFAF